jgi:hypothetical protein
VVRMCTSCGCFSSACIGSIPPQMDIGILVWRLLSKAIDERAWPSSRDLERASSDEICSVGSPSSRTSKQ